MGNVIGEVVGVVLSHKPEKKQITQHFENKRCFKADDQCLYPWFVALSGQKAVQCLQHEIQMYPIGAPDGYCQRGYIGIVQRE